MQPPRGSCCLFEVRRLLLPVLVLAASTRAGSPEGLDGGSGQRKVLGTIEVSPTETATVLGPSSRYGSPATVKTVKSISSMHLSSCSYADFRHELVLAGNADAGWRGFLGVSGYVGCPTREYEQFDSAELVDGVVRITGRVPKSADRRRGRGSVIYLVPYQDFAVPREIGTVAPRGTKPVGCLQITGPRGAQVAIGDWDLPLHADHSLLLANRCKVAIDAEGFEFVDRDEFTPDEQRWVVGPGCVIPAGERAVLVQEVPGVAPVALTLWIALCPVRSN